MITVKLKDGNEFFNVIYEMAGVLLKKDRRPQVSNIYVRGDDILVTNYGILIRLDNDRDWADGVYAVHKRTKGEVQLAPTDIDPKEFPATGDVLSVEGVESLPAHTDVGMDVMYYHLVCQGSGALVCSDLQAVCNCCPAPDVLAYIKDQSVVFISKAPPMEIVTMHRAVPEEGTI